MPSTHIGPSKSYSCLPESDKSLARIWLQGSEGWVKYEWRVDVNSLNGRENACGLESQGRQTTERGHEAWREQIINTPESYFY